MARLFDADGHAAWDGVVDATDDGDVFPYIRRPMDHGPFRAAMGKTGVLDVTAEILKGLEFLRRDLFYPLHRWGRVGL